MNHFVLVYDRATQHLVELHQFVENRGEAALACYEEEEAKALTSAADLEVVMLNAVDLDALKLTHPNYFRSAVSLESLLEEDL